MNSSDIDVDELRWAARTLLCRPLLRAGGDDARAAAIARRPAYRTELQRWFDRNLGWRLVVDREVVRLHKVPAAHDRAEDVPSQRCCVLYCLLLAALEELGEQTVLSELSDDVAQLAATHPGVPAYDAAQRRERRDLVAAVRRLVDDGVLVPTRDENSTQQDEKEFITGAGNAIYDIDHRAAAVLLACPVPPSRADTPEGLTSEPVPDTQDGQNRRRRHLLMRRLVDDPVLYLADLPDDQLAYFHSQRGSLLRELEKMLDVRVEVRAEGVAIVDDALTDIRFPRDRTNEYAALKLAGALSQEPGVRSGEDFVVPGQRLSEISEWLSAHVGNIVRTIHQQPVTPKSVREVAVRLLAELRLVEHLGDGVRVLPALGRYRSRGRDEDGPPPQLFDLDSEQLPDQDEEQE